MKIAVTGATGFIGRYLCLRLRAHGHELLRITRRVTGASDELLVADLCRLQDHARQLEGCDALLHLAGLAHVTDEAAQRELPYREINAMAAEAAGLAAKAAGVRRVVYLSSAGVHGNASIAPFDESMVPAPYDAYTASKLEGEQRLGEVLVPGSTTLTIVRPPMVVGPDAPGNLGRLMGLLRRGIPLPLGSIVNRRSYMGLHNLCDFLECCAQAEAAAGATMLVADEPSVSTPQLIRLLGEVAALPVRLLPFPTPLLRLLLSAIGRSRDWTRLSANFELDTTLARRLLGWKPPLDLKETLTQAFPPDTARPARRDQ